MRKVLLVLFTGFLLFSAQTLCAQNIAQDSIVLKDGSVYTGKIVKQSKSFIDIRNAEVTYSIDKSYIKHIIHNTIKSEPKVENVNAEQKEEKNNSNYQAYEYQPTLPYRNAGIATFMSLLFPGGGQFYNNQTGKGIGFFLWETVNLSMLYYQIYHPTENYEYIIGAACVSSLVCWIVGMVDAHKSANKINMRNRNFALFDINLGNNKYLSFSPDYNILHINNQTTQTIGLNASISF